MQLTFTFIILALTIVLFMTNRVRGDLVALMALLAFVIFGILTPSEAFAGFSNSVVIMIAASICCWCRDFANRTCRYGRKSSIKMVWR